MERNGQQGFSRFGDLSDEEKSRIADCIAKNSESVPAGRYRVVASGDRGEIGKRVWFDPKTGALMFGD